LPVAALHLPQPLVETSTTARLAAEPAAALSEHAA